MAASDPALLEVSTTPDAVERKVPKGQQKGAAKEQKQFLQETDALIDVPEAQAVAQPGGRFSTTQDLNTFDVGMEGPALPADFAEPLFGPTRRPFEDPTTSAASSRAGGKVQDTLQALVLHSNFSPDVLELLEAARALDA